ncbi:hypothetical protein SAMN05444377_10720 [Flavobacterium fontis]|uniref:MORN repeat variant n=1 Tax=Flavobacterium fontis TaxID=1124188 RepID=A0A1M5AWC7_9FLAO|nr:hypothetical protein [Flavobacterium fontis]SHF34554.1 hypothetical protein SAMN05444377_10720 [Flavobacterium fontis]
MRLIIFYFIGSTILFGQNKEITQTSFYEDGQIKSYILKSNYTHNENMYVLFDSICDKKKQKQRIVRQCTFDSNNWNNDMYYYKDSLMVYYRYGFKRKPSIGLTEYNILFLSKEKKSIGIDIEFNKDSLISRVLIYKPKHKKLEIDKIYSDFHTDPIAMKGSYLLIIDDETSIEINFLKKNIIKNISYYSDLTSDDNDFLRTYVLFHENNKPKEYGDFRYKVGRVGKWYTYYVNGQLESEGEYCGSEIDYNGNEFNLKKDGKWTYYTQQGCIDKEENWDKGKLINR